ncbi:MAG: hypothetical protein AAB597_03065 [Patescibacteria group bacterium]
MKQNHGLLHFLTPSARNEILRELEVRFSKVRMYLDYSENALERIEDRILHLLQQEKIGKSFQNRLK